MINANILILSKNNMIDLLKYDVLITGYISQGTQ